MRFSTDFQNQNVSMHGVSVPQAPASLYLALKQADAYILEGKVS